MSRRRWVFSIVMLAVFLISIGAAAATALRPPAAVTAPSPAPAATVAPQPPLSFACDVTSTGGATPAVQFTVTATSNVDGAVTASLVSVVFTDSAGQEIYSNPDVPFSETVAAGQSVTAQMSSDGTSGITGCDVESWS